jgi:uncharacterized membrane protein YqiK
MSTTTLIVIIVVAVIVILLLALFFASRRRRLQRKEEQRERTREEFGSEYERTAVVVGRGLLGYAARYVTAWAGHDGRWRMVSDQSTPIARTG